MQQNKYYVLRTGIHSSIHNVWSQLQRWRAHLRTTYFVSRKIRYRSYYTGGYYADATYQNYSLYTSTVRWELRTQLWLVRTIT